LSRKSLIKEASHALLVALTDLKEEGDSFVYLPQRANNPLVSYKFVTITDSTRSKLPALMSNTGQAICVQLRDGQVANVVDIIHFLTLHPYVQPGRA